MLPNLVVLCRCKVWGRLVMLAGSSVLGRPFVDRSVGIVVGENLAEARAVFGHRSGASLAESDSVAEAHSAQEHLAAVVGRTEIRTGDRAPSESARRLQPGRFIGAAK